MEKIRTVRGCHSSNFESILLASLLVTNDTDTTFWSGPLYIYGVGKREARLKEQMFQKQFA